MFARNSLIYLISNLFLSSIDFLLFSIAVKRFTQQEYGFISIALSFMSIYLYLSDLSLFTCHLKIMPERKDDKNLYFSAYIILKIILILVSSGIIFSIFTIQMKTDYLPVEPTFLFVVILYYLINTVQSISLVYKGSLQSEKQIVKIQLSELLGRVINLIIGLIAVLVFKNFLFYITSNLIGKIITLIILFFYGKIYKFLFPGISILKKYISTTGILIIPQILIQLNANLGNIIFLRFFNESFLGISQIINGLLFVFPVIQISIENLILPELTKNGKDSSFKINDFYNNYLKITLIIWSIIMTVAFILSYPLLHYFINTQFFEIAQIYFFLSIFNLIELGLNHFFLLIFIAYQKYHLLIIETIMQLFLSLLSWYFLIPFFNIAGLIFGNSIALIINTIISRIIIKKEKIITISRRNNVLLLILVIYNGFQYCFMISNVFQFSIRLIISIFTSLLFYIFICFSTVFISKIELKDLASLLDIRKLGIYIKEELKRI